MSTPVGSAQVPSYLAIRDLVTGTTREMSLGGPGGLVTGEDPVWSPDGSEIALIPPTAPVDQTTVDVLSAAHPDLADAQRFSVAEGCAIGEIGAWTDAGITLAVTCRGPHGTVTSGVEQVRPSGAVTDHVDVPGCLGIDAIESSLPGAPAFVEAILVPGTPDLGPSGQSCREPTTVASELDGGSLRRVVASSALLSFPD